MSALVNAIKKVATGPHLTKNLTQDEANLAMTEILSGQTDPVQAAIFFIALRIKVETYEENSGILKALQASTKQYQADIDQLLIISDPFNGFNRHCPISAFLPAVLAASGLATLSQGVKEMGPKFGITHSQVLAEAGINVDLTVQQATERLNNTELSWSFIDQRHATPDLYALQELRTRMIKRPSLATLEKIIMPIKSQRKTHLQIGFVHKVYPAVLAKLAQQAGFDSALIIRGIEGGVLPTLREESHCFQSTKGIAEDYLLKPVEFGIKQSTRGLLSAKGTNVSAQQTVELALQALSGQTGVAFDSLVLGAASALWHCGLQNSQQQAADHVRKVIKSGCAKVFFERAIG